MAGNKFTKLISKITHKNPLETAANVGGLGTALVDSVKKDVLQASATDMWKQILGAPEQPENNQRNGEVVMKPNQEFVLNGKKSRQYRNPDWQRPAGPDQQNGKQEVTKPERKLNIAAGYDYRSEILHTEKLSRRESSELTQKVDEIMVELKRLVDSSSVLQAEFSSVTTAQRPTEVGKYHLHFFEWMLIMIKSARMKVEDSGAWLRVMGSKKKQRQYGAMAKKHGTTFTLSNERVVATQTG